MNTCAKIFCVVFLIAAGSKVYPQAVTWQREYARPFNVYGTCIVETFDKGFLICGQTTFQDSALFILKTNFFGDTLWSRRLDGEYATKIVQTKDSNFLIVGQVNSESFILKINSCGELLWIRKYAIGKTSHISDLKELKNDDILFFGSCSLSLFHTTLNFFLLKTNFSGDTLWVKYYDSTKAAGHMSFYSNNRILLTAGRFSQSIAIIVDTIGTLIRSSNMLMGQGMCDSVNKYFYFVSNVSGGNINFIKTDTLFNIEISNTIDSTSITFKFYNMILNSNKITICGYLTSSENKKPSGFIMNINTSGNVIWLKKYINFNRYSYLENVNLCFDKGYISTGTISSQLDGGIDNLFAIKTDSAGNTVPLSISPNSNLTTKYDILYQNYPNPFNSTTIIPFSITQKSNVIFCIYNSIGQLVKRVFNSELESGFYTYEYSALGLSSGLYFYTIIITNSFGNNLLTRKFLLIK